MQRLSVVEARESEFLSQEVYNQIFGPFDRGEFRELTDQKWQALTSPPASGRRASDENQRSP